MTVSNQLVVPITLFGNRAPTHCISVICMTESAVITGSYDGHICIWNLTSEKGGMVPRCLLFGHSSPVLCLAPSGGLLVSSSEAGEVALLDTQDGRCLESARMPYVHTAIHTHTMGDRVRLFCNGYYCEIVVLDLVTLEVVFVLSSRLSPDWLSAIHVLRPVKSQADVVIGITAAGYVKIWTLSGLDKRTSLQENSEPIYEDESKPIRCLNALKLTCCMYNQRTVLVVCSKYWQVFDAGDFSLLCSTPSPQGERWLGGDFLATDRVVAFSDAGRGYLYKLPTTANPDSSSFHSQQSLEDQPLLFGVLSVPADRPLLCPPAMALVRTTLLRGDSSGRVVLFDIPSLHDEQLGKFHTFEPKASLSLQEAWDAMQPSPAGILDQFLPESPLQLTASVYLPLQGRLVVGREDGSIVIVPATQTVMLQVLYGRHQSLEDWPPHQLLQGHAGRVTCLLYPHLHHSRYELSHLLSGSVDFSVCLWDLYTGSLLHRFCVHAGEITQLIVPPVNCNNRVLQSVCSVASDHSVGLLALKDKKCVMLASRHLFPVQVIKFRPLHDFMVVGCADGSAYCWQMETGHLDRYVSGLAAEEILSACDETVVSSTDRMTNPAVHFFRGLRHRNLAAIRHATQRTLNHLHHPQAPSASSEAGGERARAQPLLIQGLRTNPKDQDSHVLFFDIEALVVQLLSEEYASLSPGQLEVQGLINPSEQEKYMALSSSASTNSPEMMHFSGLISKMKDTAVNAALKIEAKAESVGLKTAQAEVPARRKEGGGGEASLAEANLTMEVAQLLLSLLHAWGLDAELDRACEAKLGLLRPRRPVCFGLLSRAGHMALILPTHLHALHAPPDTQQKAPGVRQVRLLPPELVVEEERARIFSSRGHWELSPALTTTHLLAVIALANTLMSMNSATFIPEQERRRKLHRRLSRADSKAALQPAGKEQLAEFSSQQAQIKQGWSLLAALHCVLLPDCVNSPRYQCPQVEMLARRWQDRCLEVREAAQALLLAELRRISPRGRKQLVEEWAPFLPNYGEAAAAPPAAAAAPPSSHAVEEEHGGKGGEEEQHSSEEEEHDDHSLEEANRRVSATEGKRKQTTAIVLLGVIGAEYGHEIQETASKDKRRSNVVDGFSLANDSLARYTSQALAFLLLVPPSASFPAHTALRRAAIDLIGRGFTVWQRYLDVSKVLLGLLELCCDSDKLVPSMSYGLPLTPAADSCRTARHALSLIALARPAAFITTLVKEVARYNALAQNAQALNISLHATVLSRAKPEILRVVELLIDKKQSDVSDLLVEVMDIVIHCLDGTQLKARGLKETFPAVCRFYNVSYCTSTRRIAVGAKSGQLAMYELRASKCQMISAHAAAINACAFSPDGKFLASYSSQENKLCFWQTATGLFGLGNAQTRCIRTYNTPPLNEAARAARLQWPANKVVSLITDDHRESRFSVT